MPRFATTALETHRPGIVKYCRAHIADPAEAEDVAQDVFCRALAALERGTQPQNVGAWLATIARHLVIDHYRARARHARLAGQPVAIDAAEPQPSRELSPLEHAIGAEWAQRIEASLQTLTAGQETAARLHLEGCDQNEMAQVMQTGVGAAKAMLTRGRVNLRQQLEHLR